jgi:hypothetical protein
MKTFLVILISAVVLPFAAWSQPAPAAPPAAASSPAAPAFSPAIAPNPSPESSLEESIRKKQNKHFNFTIGKNDSKSSDADEKRHHSVDDDVPAMVVPLVGIVFLTIFGAPVLIVAVILYFGFSKSRMQHRTIRMMVEKGQAVPAELLAPPAPALRQRSDMRRGVVLTMVGIGVLVWLGAVNDWEGGIWSLGLIPLLIGVGYLIVWMLEGGKSKGKADNPPPLP